MRLTRRRGVAEMTLHRPWRAVGWRHAAYWGSPLFCAGGGAHGLSARLPSFRWSSPSVFQTRASIAARSRFTAAGGGSSIAVQPRMLRAGEQCPGQDVVRFAPSDGARNCGALGKHARRSIACCRPWHHQQPPVSGVSVRLREPPSSRPTSISALKHARPVRPCPHGDVLRLLSSSDTSAQWSLCTEVARKKPSRPFVVGCETGGALSWHGWQGRSWPSHGSPSQWWARSSMKCWASP